jgi:cupin superfamily acireductone dioxygenase involved in methionine salvage
MALVKIPDENRTLADTASVTQCLAEVGIHYERWQPSHPVEADASPEEFSRLTHPKSKSSRLKGVT